MLYFQAHQGMPLSMHLQEVHRNMRIQIEREDYDKVFSQIEKETRKAINKVALQTVFDFENDLKLRRYLIMLIKDCVREELKFKEGITFEKEKT